MTGRDEKKNNVIALYMRVSLEDEEAKAGSKAESESIANQRKLLRDFVDGKEEFRRCKVVEWYDDGYSGTNFRRPAMKGLLEEVEKGTVNCIVVKDFSRFGRDYLVVSDYVEQIFPFLGVRFISVNDGYDSARDVGTAKGLEMAFRNLAYGWYSRDISEKEKSGKRIRAQRGDYLNAYAPIGYRKDEKNKNCLVVEEQGAEIVRHIFMLAGTGCTVKEIALLLNGEGVPTPSALKREQGHGHPWWEGIHGESLWDISSITRILRDERYLGKVVYGKRRRLEVGDYKGRKNDRESWVVVCGCHEPIVTEEEFGAAQNMLRKYRGKRRRGEGEGIFRGKVRCGTCGYAMVRKKGEIVGYGCVTGERAAKFACMDGVIAEAKLADVAKSVIRLYEQVFGGKRGEEREEGKGENGRKKERGDGRKGMGKERYAVIKRKWEAYDRACKGLAERKARLYERMLDEEWEREKYVKKRDLLMEEERKLQMEKERWKRELQIEEEGRKGEFGAEKESGKLMKEEDRGLSYELEGLSYELVNAILCRVVVYDRTILEIQWNFDINSSILGCFQTHFTS